jgi:hypothetical protein
VPGRGFCLISAGTYTPDAAAILRHPRWEKLAQGFRETGASLLLFVPADAPGLAGLARWVKDAIVLAEPGHAEDVELGIPDFVAVHAWLTPPQAPGGEATAGPAPSGSPFLEPKPAGGFRPWEAPAGSLAAPVAEEFRTAEETVGAPAATLPVPDPAWEEPAAETAPRRFASPILIGLLVIALLAGGVYALTLFKPELFRRSAPASTVRQPRTAARPAGPVAEAGVQLPYSVWVNAYPSYDAARRRVDQLAGRFPDAHFYLTYENTNGVPYYKVFSGALTDSTEASELRRRLLDRREITPDAVGTEGDLILVRPYTLELGEFASQEAAEARVDSLAVRQIPAYAVPVPFSDGSERWKVFGGAFEDSVAAQPMIQMARHAQLPTRLVRRTGRAPAAPK